MPWKQVRKRAVWLEGVRQMTAREVAKRASTLGTLASPRPWTVAVKKRRFWSKPRERRLISTQSVLHHPRQRRRGGMPAVAFRALLVALTTNPRRTTWFVDIDRSDFQRLKIGR